MHRALVAFALLLSACAPAPVAPAASRAGLTATLRVPRTSYRPMERIVLEFEIKNVSPARIEVPVVRWWDRRYSWHNSRFKESEAELLVRDLSRAMPERPTSASG